MAKKFIPVKKTTFFVACTDKGDPIPLYGFTFFKKQMIAKLKRANDKRQLLIAPVVFTEAQTWAAKNRSVGG